MWDTEQYLKFTLLSAHFSGLQRKFAKPLCTFALSPDFAFYPLAQFVKVGSQKPLLADEGDRAKMLVSALWLSAHRTTRYPG
ncbi:hypothetical protein QMZ30_22930 [Pantoea sp. EA-12]|uniref:hypothetical protein n=1 Tax=Pantoea sp. EA-12 TaxID=3043303 RepID=UPI0024B4BE14|nr:hypothetical protein [Pantoea sp. EA-12]MDI9223777.1 hypothetical protein [Pantoea sp. EA-12]